MLWGQRKACRWFSGAACGWGSNQFDPLQWFLVLLSRMPGKGHWGFTHCLAWIFILSVPSGPPGTIWQEFNHNRRHRFAGMVSLWLLQTRAKRTHPSLQNLLPMKDFRPCHRLEHSLPLAPNSQVWAPGLWNARVWAGLELSWQWGF